MSVKIQFLKWDSDFFGFPVFRIDGNQIEINEFRICIDECLQLNAKLLYVFISSEDEKSKDTMQAFSASLVDKKVTYKSKLIEENISKETNENISSINEYSSDLEKLAFQSGEFSRFNIDSNFSPDSFKNLYREWLINSLNGAIASDVLTFRNKDKKAIGLLTLGRKNDVADIGILAVDYASRGQSIGKQLIHSAFSIAHKKFYKEIQVVTQLDNKLACKFYEKCGFLISNTEYVYHIWLQ